MSGSASVNGANTSEASGTIDIRSMHWDDLPERQQNAFIVEWDLDPLDPAHRSNAKTLFMNMSPGDRWHLVSAASKRDGSYVAERARIDGNADAATSAAFEALREEGGSEVAALIELNRHRLLTGGAILNAPETVESVWGDGHRCLWAKGEPFILCGPDGVGKTTIAQQLVLRLVGAIDDPFLGLTVQAPGRVLYLACDRPTQALRSFRRMVGGPDGDILDENLRIWAGPLPFDIRSQPTALVELALGAGAQVVVIDSLKDVAADLPKDETGVAVNTAFQHAVAEKVQICALHHQRKQQTGGAKPRHLSDVYGSRWITAGAGGVVMLWGEPGDLVVEMDHLKQADETVGPLKLIHDHVYGVTTIMDVVDAWSVVSDANNGIDARAVASALYETSSPDRNQIEKARRQLERLFREKRIHKQDGAKGGRAGENATLYFPLTSRQD